MRIAFVTARGGYTTGSYPPVVGHLEAAGLEVERFEDGDPAADSMAGGLFLAGSAGWYPGTMRRLAALSPERQPPVLLWLTEPLPPPLSSGLAPSRRSLRDVAKLALHDARANDQRTNLAHAVAFSRMAAHGTLVASTIAKVETLAEHGVQAPFVPFGTRPARSDAGAAVVRDLDVLFVGDPAVPHRRKALRYLRRAGIEITTRGAWHPTRGLWGDERDALLDRTTLLLNISRHPGNAADARLALGAVHGAVTVSEPMYRPDPWIAGTHFEAAPLVDLPDLIRELLADEERRHRLAAAARALAAENTLADTARRLAALVAAPPAGLPAGSRGGA